MPGALELLSSRIFHEPARALNRFRRRAHDSSRLNRLTRSSPESESIMNRQHEEDAAISPHCWRWPLCSLRLRRTALRQGGLLPGCDPICRSTYWQSAVAGFKKAAAQYEVTARVVGPDTYDPQAELAELQKAVAAKPAGILISVADASVLQPGIDAAIDAGIPVITVDSDAAGSRRLYFIGTNNLEAGRLGGHRVVEKLGGKGNVVFFTIAGQPNTEERLKGFKDVFASAPASTSSKWSTSRAIRASPSTRRSSSWPRPAPRRSTPTSALIGLGQDGGRRREAHRRHQPLLVAWDVNQDTLDGIKDGMIDSTVVQKPFTMGYVGLKALDEIFHYPPAQLGKDYSADAFAPYPSLWIPARRWWTRTTSIFTSPPPAEGTQ